jgi:hypothetical protein
MNENDQALFVPGNDLGKFIAPSGAGELPSVDFDHHFCKIDMNFSESLMNFYSLVQPKSRKKKLLLSGDLNGFFSDEALYGVLQLK